MELVTRLNSLALRAYACVQVGGSRGMPIIIATTRSDIMTLPPTIPITIHLPHDETITIRDASVVMLDTEILHRHVPTEYFLSLEDEVKSLIFKAECFGFISYGVYPKVFKNKMPYNLRSTLLFRDCNK